MSISGNRIKELREKKGVTQQTMADAVGIVSQTMSNIECDRHNPSYDIIKGIAMYLGVTVDELDGMNK